jgi:hypothetical protein
MSGGLTSSELSGGREARARSGWGGLWRVVNRYVMIWVARRRKRGQEKRILKDPAARR